MMSCAERYCCRGRSVTAYVLSPVITVLEPAGVSRDALGQADEMRIRRRTIYAPTAIVSTLITLYGDLTS